jgi:predicted RNA methylase
MESTFGDLAGKRVADLGCGCGMLTVGASMFSPGFGHARMFACNGADSIVGRYIAGVDIDPDALEAAAQNAEDFEFDIDFINADLGFGF